MTNQEKKVELQKYRAAVREADRLALEIQRWQSTAEKMTPVIHLAPAGGAGGRSMELAVEQIDDLTCKLGDQQVEAVRIRIQIGNAIASVSDERLRELLRLRYIEGSSFEQIAVTMNYSWRQVLRLHGTALNEVVIECHI